jgi:hypothetical protein
MSADNAGKMLSITYENCYVVIDVSTDGGVCNARVLLSPGFPDMEAHDGTRMQEGSALYEAIMDRVVSEVREEYALQFEQADGPHHIDDPRSHG